MGDNDAAQQHHAQSVAMLAPLHEQDHGDERIATSYGAALTNLGLCHERRRDPAAAAAAHEASIAVWRRLAVDHAEVPTYHVNLGAAISYLARTVSPTSRQIELLDESIAVARRAVAIAPQSTTFRWHLLQYQRDRLMKLCKVRRHRDVVAGAASLAGTDPTDEAQARFAAQFVAYAIPAVHCPI
jgi:hypothetical protein